MNAIHAALWSRVQAHVLDDPRSPQPFSLRLAKENAWGPAFTRRVIEEYRRFAFLAVAAGHPVSPSDAIDQAWHLHLLYTRDYWGEFCPRVLGTSLHHGPARGGAQEQEKLSDWYAKTLSSYRASFGEPPADIWPEPACHPMTVRVDVDRHWIIRQPQVVLRLRTWLNSLASAREEASGSPPTRPAAGTTIDVDVRPVAGRGAATLLGLAFCAALLQPIGMVAAERAGGGLAEWPFNLRGLEFLLFYVCFAAGVFALAAVLRWFLRVPSSPAAMELCDGYEIAELGGGHRRAFVAAIASLSQRRLIVVQERKIVRPSDWMPDGLPLLERAILGGTLPGSKVRISTVRKAALDALGSLRAGLVERGLVMSAGARANARFTPLLLALVVPAVGVAKIWIGLSRDRPVGFLVALTLIATGGALALFLRCPHLTRRGDAQLRRLRDENAGLRASGDLATPEGLANLPIALGLFGFVVLANTPLAELPEELKDLQPTPGFGGWGKGQTSDGCISFSSGGGCGGGSGCGGCGGD
jgi:uncharacterized protein (TIGR04222 family)